MKTAKYIASLFFYTCISTLSFAAEEARPEKTVDGMFLVDGTKMAAVYAKPGVDLSQYNRIYLLPPQVSFIKNWLQSQNSIPNQRVTSDDMQRIKKELADLFVEVFRQELQNNGGYVLVDGVAEDVLIVRPALVDLNVQSPDTPGTRGSRSAIASAGSMTLYMELIDSVTGDKLVRAIDNKFDRTRTRIAATNRSRNEAVARNMLSEWASLLRQALDEARTVVSK